MAIQMSMQDSQMEDDSRPTTATSEDARSSEAPSAMETDEVIALDNTAKSCQDTGFLPKNFWLGESNFSRVFSRKDLN